MKKILITVFICLITLSIPTLAQDVQNKLDRYVNSQLTTTEQSEITTLPEEQLQANLTIEEIRTVLEEIVNSGECTVPDIVQDLNDYIIEESAFSAVGDSNLWEKKRSELYRYIQSSNWHTGKNISDADRAFIQTLKTIAFGLIKEAAQLCGWDRILDRLEQESINKYENSEQIQYAVATVKANINDALNDDDHAIETLYTAVQHNAFTLLTINYIDYKKLSNAFPEVKFLFEDLYTFFKWRYDLRNNDASYKLNEDNINVKFRQAAATNSFFAFWELANIAKAEMRKAVENEDDNLTVLTVSDERDNMEFFEAYAKQALYFGRIWNGMQRYVVKKNFLPKTLNPKRGACKSIIEKDINKSLDPLNKEQLLNVLNDVRINYNAARSVAEKYWNNWASVNLTEQKKLQIQKQLHKLLQQITEERIEDTINSLPQIDTLQNTLPDTLPDTLQNDSIPPVLDIAD